MSYVRVHFAKTQVQLRLDQHPGISCVYGINAPPFLLQRMERKGEGRRPGGWRGLLKGSLQSGLANDNRIYCLSNRAFGGCRLRHAYCHEGLCRIFGCTLRRHKCNCPWSRTQAKHRMCGIITPPSILQRMERKGEGRRPGGWRGLLKGSLQSGLANDNRIYCPSNRAFEGCCLQYPYCPEGFVTCIRVHFAKAQVQLRLDQNSS